MLSLDVKELLEDIVIWMVENNYECGEVGADIFNRIDQILNEKEHPSG